MKITIILGPFYFTPPKGTGAVEKRWMALAESLAAWGHSVVVLSRQAPVQPKPSKERNIRLLGIAGFEPSTGHVGRLLKDFIYSFRAIRKVPRDSDIVVTNTFWLPILAGYFCRTKVYVDVSRFPKGQLRFYKNAARLRVPSNAMAKAIFRQAPHLQNRVRVIPNPLPFPVPPPNTNEREKVILYLGRLHPEKGVELLILAFKKLAQRGFGNWRLCLVGPWETQYGGGGAAFYGRLQKAAKGSEGQIEWGGRAATPEALTSHYRRAGLFVYPSLAERGESFGLAPLEAMSHGTPVLVSKLECFSDFISHDQTGFAFDHRADDPEQALVNSMVRCLESESLRLRVGEAAAVQARAFDLASVTCSFLEDFESLVENKWSPRKTQKGGG